MRLKAGDFEGLTFRIRKNVATAAEQIRTRGEYFSSLLALGVASVSNQSAGKGMAIAGLVMSAVSLLAYIGMAIK